MTGAAVACGTASRWGRGVIHVLAGVELDGPARRLAALLDPPFLRGGGIRQARCCPCPRGTGCWRRYAGAGPACTRAGCARCFATVSG